MSLTLAVISLASAAVAQEFIPIGGGSGRVQGPVNPGFGETFTPSFINPNDPSFKPANFPGNRPNPVPIFPKSQRTGTPHEAPVDFTFIHQHSYKDPFRSDQTLTDFINPVHGIGAAHPNIPRTLGREHIYIDPRADPNGALAQAEAEKKKKNMIFFGLAPPVEKLHRADEFAPSTLPLENPWDRWYDRFEESPADKRKQFSLTVTKRPNLVDIPFYAADRGKREVEMTTEVPVLDSDELTSTTTTLATISDAVGATTDIAPLDTTTSAFVTDGQITISINSESTTPGLVAATTNETITAAADSVMIITTTTTAAPSTTTSSAAAVLAPVNLTAPTAPSTPALAASLNDVLSAPTAKKLLDDKNQTSATPVPSTGPSIPIRPHHRRQHTTAQPASTVQKLRALNTKVPPRTTLPGAEKATIAPIARKATLKLDNATGSAKNATLTRTTKLPMRNTTFQRRTGKTRVPLRRLLNVTSTTVAPTTATTSASTATKSSTGTKSSGTTSATPAPTTVKALKTLQRVNSTRTKAPFRIFSRRPLNAAKLPARTPIVEAPKPSITESNSVGELRTEVNRLLTTVVQLQSTVIAQQQRIALLENQLRLRRGAPKVAHNKTSRFIAPNGRTVERTIMDVRKGRSAKRNVVAQSKLRQKSSLA